MRTIRDSVLIGGVSWRVDFIDEPTSGGRIEFRHGVITHGLAMGELPAVEEFWEFTTADLGVFLQDARDGGRRDPDCRGLRSRRPNLPELLAPVPAVAKN